MQNSIEEQTVIVQAIETEHACTIEMLERKKRQIDEDGDHCSKSSYGAKTSQLPPFDDMRDEMDSYLSRFEMYTVWKREFWAINHSALLKGEALDVSLECQQVRHSFTRV